MSELAVIDAHTGELLDSGALVPKNLFGATRPQDVVLRAREHAVALADVIQERKLFKVIGEKAHVYVEAWCLLGSMVGVFPVEDGDAEPVEVDGVKGFKASVKAMTLNGEVVGRATAYCMRDESLWKNRDIHALAAMAQTRATSRALRQPLGYIVQLAGYSATGAEEMSGVPKSPRGEAAITDSQRKRLFAIATKNKVTEERLRELVQQIAGVNSTQKIPKNKYDEIISAVEVEDVPFA